MYFMYVDETGDTGLTRSPSRYFGLSGIVVHESRWREFIDLLVGFKRTMRDAYGLPVRSEIHASEFIRSSATKLEPHVRLAILRNFLDEIAKWDFISITNILVDKSTKPAAYDVFDNAWQTLFQRFENTLKYGNFPGGHRNDHGFVITDATNGRKLSRLMRRMAVHNYIPNQAQFGHGARNQPITRVIEDPYGKNSRTTLPIQACDTVAYFLLQSVSPNSFIQRKHAQSYFYRLGPVLNTAASRDDAHGIVRL